MRPAHHLHGEEAGKISARFAIQPQQESSPPGCFSCFFYPSAQQIGKESLMEKQELDALLAELSAQLRELGFPPGQAHRTPGGGEHPGPAAAGLLRLPGGPVHHPGVCQAAGGCTPAARHPFFTSCFTPATAARTTASAGRPTPSGWGRPWGGNHPHRPLEGPAQPLRQEPVKYLLQCQSCGRLIPRRRLSKAVKYPSRYPLPCGGKLRRVDVSPLAKE